MLYNSHHGGRVNYGHNQIITPETFNPPKFETVRIPAVSAVEIRPSVSAVEIRPSLGLTSVSIFVSKTIEQNIHYNYFY
jgi:hypothetical protein